MYEPKINWIGRHKNIYKKYKHTTKGTKSHGRQTAKSYRSRRAANHENILTLKDKGRHTRNEASKKTEME